MFPTQIKGIQRKSEEEQTRERILNKIAEAERADEIKQTLKMTDNSDTSVFETLDNIDATELITVTSQEITPDMSEADFLDKFDIPLGKNKKDKKAYVTFFVHVATLIGGFTVLGTSLFATLSPIIVLVCSIVISVLLYCLLCSTNKTIVNIVSSVITFVFAGAIVTVVRNFGILLFGECSFFTAFVVSTALLFMIMVAYFLLISNKTKKGG